MAFDADDTKNSGQTTYPNEWKGSDLEAWLNGAEFYAGSVFSGIEKDAIAETALAEQSGYSAGNHGDSYQDYSAQNHVFCLSAAEADGLYADHNARRKTGRKYWWLRSAHSALGSNVGVVEINGVISPTFVGNDDDVSPALNLNLSSVLLASENGMGKSSALAPVSDSTATQWKLTLCDSGKTVNVTSGQNVERTDAGGSTTITVPYTYTDSNTANPVNQISVMITDKAYTESDAQILYYGALQGVTISNPAATGTFTLPANLANQTCGTDYYAYIIAEDVNGEKETDYASAPAAITIPAASGSNPVTPDTPAASVKGKGLGVSIIADPTAPAATTDAWKGSYVYFGTYNSNPVKYRVLDRTTTDFGGTTMLLDCDSILWKGDNPSSKFDDSSNVWSSSYIKKYLNSESPYESTGFLSGSFTNLEQTAIAASSKASPSTTDGNGVSNLNYAALSNDKIFLLDAKEVTNTSYGYSITITPDANRRKPGTSNAEWWLRSAEGAGAALTSTGLVAAGGHFDFLWVGDDDIGVSPAFNLNLPSVLFSSVLSGTSGQPGAEYKLTLQDNEMTITAGTITRDSGDGITVPYTIGGTNGGNATQVSLMVLDKEYTAGNTNGARLVAYEKLADAGNTRGTFTLTSDMKNGSYYYYIVAEDVNGGNATDYASAPQPITIPSLKYTITITNGTLSGGSTTGDYAQGETVTITADAAPDGQQFKEWTVESGSITLADSTSATTTFTMPAEAVSVKANYEKIITSVEVNISQPTPGNNLAGTAAVSTPGVKTASPDITWKEGSKTAGPTAGYHAAYTAEVTLSPDTDYVFASQVTANIKADGTTVGSGTVTNNASGTITISYTFAATRKANVIRIINPAAITGVANGTAKTVAALGLPGTVMMETEDGNRMADVTWDLSNLTGTYEPSVLTEQTFTADGKVTLPSDLGNGRNITLNASVQVTVSEAGVVGAVQATPPEGTYSSNQKIVLRSSTDGAEIYYTIDGSEPGRTNGTKYTEAIDVTGREGQSVQTRIKAMAVKSGMKDSGAVTFTYTIQIPASKYTVTVTGGSTTGEYAQGETVTITAGAAPEGQQFKEWVVESGNITLADSTGETTSFTMPAGEVKVRAVYEEGRNPGGGAADPGAGGTANPGGGGPAASNTPGSPATPDTTYQIINGANGSWVYGSDEGLTIRGNGEFSRFTGVRVDGGLLDQSNYTAREGSTIITLKTSYLNALAAGKHTVEILWMDGSAGTTFTINANASRDSALPGGTNKKDDVPKTGDSIPIVGLFILAGLSGAGLIFTGGKGRKNPEASGK